MGDTGRPAPGAGLMSAAHLPASAGRRYSRRYFTTLARPAVPKTAGLAERTTLNPIVAPLRFTRLPAPAPAPKNTGGAPWTALYRACSLCVSIIDKVLTLLV